MTKKIKCILELFAKNYPWDGVCFLQHEGAWQLLCATILSAQCTDERVNQVTKILFAKYPCVETAAGADLIELEKIIHSTGFFRAKARNIIGCANIILKEFNAIVPSDLESLIKMPGVGRKTANVVRAHVFGIPCVTVDTHVGRVARRLGLTVHNDAVKIEHDLMKVLPRSSWINMNAQMIMHGRAVCKSQRPRCGECVFLETCSFNKICEGAND
jgi:endonuclease-3